jgi:protein-L-isoaspartate(D-aspartate) O-methyltransferase
VTISSCESKEREAQTRRIEEALAAVNRDAFLPAGYKGIEEDMAVPLAPGVTCPPVSYTRLILELLDLKPSDRVFEVGTGSGYQAAVMAKMCAEVVTTEVGLVSELQPWAGESGQSRLLPESVSVFSETDGRFLPINQGVFDAVLVTCGTDKVYDFWKNILAEGGRLVVPLKREDSSRSDCEITLFKKVSGKLNDFGLFGYADFVPIRRA